VSVTIKSKIRYNGQEYASPAELPPEIRAAYERALREVPTRINFVLNGEHFAQAEMPANVRRLCDDVMGVIENNGEVTLPDREKSEPLLSKRELAIVALFTGGILALVIARFVAG